MRRFLRGGRGLALALIDQEALGVATRNSSIEREPTQERQSTSSSGARPPKEGRGQRPCANGVDGPTP